MVKKHSRDIGLCRLAVAWRNRTASLPELLIRTRSSPDETGPATSVETESGSTHLRAQVSDVTPESEAQTWSGKQIRQPCDSNNEASRRVAAGRRSYRLCARHPRPVRSACCRGPGCCVLCDSEQESRIDERTSATVYDAGARLVARQRERSSRAHSQKAVTEVQRPEKANERAGGLLRKLKGEYLCGESSVDC